MSECLRFTPTYGLSVPVVPSGRERLRDDECQGRLGQADQAKTMLGSRQTAAPCALGPAASHLPGPCQDQGHLPGPGSWPDMVAGRTDHVRFSWCAAAGRDVFFSPEMLRERCAKCWQPPAETSKSQISRDPRRVASLRAVSSRETEPVRFFQDIHAVIVGVGRQRRFVHLRFLCTRRTSERAMVRVSFPWPIPR